MREQLIKAAQEGTVIGVKYGIALVVLLFAISWWLGDYGVVRQRAYHGQIAWERQETVLKQQQSRATPRLPLPAPK